MKNCGIFLTIFLTFLLNQVLAEERGYVLLVPRVLAQKSGNELQLQRFQLDGPGKVTIQLMRNYNDSVLASQDFDVEAGTSKSYFNFECPEVDDYEARIQLKGKFEIENEDDYEIFGEDKVTFKTAVKKIVFIQTDKPLYKPEQIVQIRVLATDTSLKPLDKTKQISMWVEDPSNNRIAQWKNISLGAGIIQREFMLTNEPNLGNWKIITSIDGVQDYGYFEVKEYVLPKFDVTIIPPPYVLITDESFDITVSAKYTYGKPVEGDVKLNVTLEKYSWSQEKFPTLYHEGKIDGTFTYTIDVSKIDEDFSNTYRRITVSAQVMEAATGTVRNATIGIDRIQNPLTLRHDTESGSGTYTKPGLPYRGTLKVTKPDGVEAENEPIELCCTISRQRVLSSWWATRKVKYCRNYTSDANGLVNYVVPPQNTDVASVNIEAKSTRNFTSSRPNMPMIYSPQASVYLRPWYSPSGTHVQIQNIREPLKCGEKATIQLLFTAKTEGTYKFYYEVTSSGKVLQSGFVAKDFLEKDNLAGGPCEDCITLDAKEIQIVPSESSIESEDFTSSDNDDNNCKAIRDATYIPMLGSMNITIDVTADESQSFHFLAYNIRDDREVVADSQKFTVEKCFNNKVELTFGEEVKQPGTKATLKLTSSPNSLCGIKVVDKSVKLLNSNEPLTVQKVFDELQRVDSNHYYPRSHCYDKKVQPGLERKLASSAIIPPRPWSPSSSYEDSLTAFELSGYLVISDLILLTRPCRSNEYSGGYGGVAMPSMGVRGAAAFAAPQRRGPTVYKTTTAMAEESFGDRGMEVSSTATKSVVDVRSFFPETWLFDLLTVPENGEVTSKVVLPHSITEWIGNAACINEEDGLGLTTKDTRIKGFQAFFLSFTLPYSVIRGEKLSVIVTVFNYLDKCLPITLTFEQTDGFKLLSDQSVVDLCVCGGKSVSEKFVIEPTILDVLNLTASAKNSENVNVCDGQEVADVVARDALTNPLLVEAEGFPYEKVDNVLFCPSEADDGTFKQKFTYEVPEDVVEDSARGYFSVSGNIMGSTLENLDHLIRLPTGCGEQNMITFSPIVYVLDYLTATRQLEGTLEAKAIGFLNSGYQRELKYRHSDGSFSTFGDRDRSGSTFLTAFVLRSFAEASKYISPDENVMQSMKDWIVPKQKPDGSFPEIGATLSHGIKGGLNASSPALTAYVITSLIAAGYDNKTVIDAALTFITSEEEQANDPYKAALFAYAFAMAGERDVASQYLSKALNKAETSDGEIKWNKDGSAANSVSLETAAYAILTLLKLDEPREKSLAIVRSVTKSRNSRGGFYSTQDTILVLQALSQFATGLNKDDVNLQVALTGNINENVAFTEDDKLQVRKLKTSDVPSELEVEATGTGCGLMQATVLCNTKNPQKKEVFDLKVEASRSSNCKDADVVVCTRYIPESEKSNMALIEIKMVSGMAADKDSLNELLGNSKLNLKRYEINNNNLAFYFDELTNNETCFKFKVNEIAEVQDVKPATAKVYDYYAIEKQQEEVYSIDSQSC